MSFTNKLIAAALTGAVLGAAGCSSTTANTEPTTPAAGDKASCKAGGGSCKGAASCNGAAGGDKASCKQSGSCTSMPAPAQGAPAPAAPAPAQ
ncbi:MAG TPA: hypothetical protein VHM19_07110 [Polyangiales bacterium]|nr:hypothetical protein [Polyangiales bacterium]